MDVRAVKSQIQTKQFGSFYIFTGPELKVAEIYINQIAKVFNADIVRLDEATDLLKRLNNTFLLSEMRHIYVLRDCKDFLSSEKLQAKFERFRASDSIVILVYTSIDKRSKLYKKFQDKIVQFDYMSEDVLVKYIQKEIPLSDRNAKGLVQICDRDYSRILLEIDKIKNYEEYYKSHSRISHVQMNPDNCFIDLIQNEVIYQSPQDRIFDFVDAVLKNKPKLAFDLYTESIEFGENILTLISVLYANTKQLLQYQSYEGNNLESATGLTAFQIKLAKGRVGYYSDDFLIYLMNIIRHCEQGIKKGQIEESVAIYYILIAIWA